MLAGPVGGWRDPATDEVRRTFTIVTTAPNEAMADAAQPDAGHPRRGRLGRWLDPTFKERGRLRAMLEPRDEPELAIRAVSQLVNNVRNDGPELVVPI